MMCPSTFVILICMLSLVASALTENQNVLLDLLPAFAGQPLRYGANSSQTSVNLPSSVYGLHARQLCAPGEALCSGGCAPDDTVCCPGYYCAAGFECCAGDTCAPAGAQCCAGDTYCPSSYECCHSNCAPAGGICCPDGNWCPAGNECIADQQTGQHYCCTNPYCTEYVNPAGATVQGYAGQGSYYNVQTTRPLPQSPLPTVAPAPATQASTTPQASVPVQTSITTQVQSVTSASPTPTQSPVPVYQYYYTTITWYFLSYYFTYLVEPTSSTITSTYITTTTVLSVSATDGTQASATLAAVGASFLSSTPVAATTALASATALPSSTASSSSTKSFSAGGGGVGVESSTAPAAVSTGAGRFSKSGWWTIIAFLVTVVLAAVAF